MSLSTFVQEDVKKDENLTHLGQESPLGDIFY